MSLRFIRSAVLACTGMAYAVSADDIPSEKPSDSFSFAVVADPRAEGPSWRNALREIRDMKTNPSPAFSPAQWIVVAGDIDPAVLRYADYTNAFPSAQARPPLLAVVGNHDLGAADFPFIRDVMIPAVPGIIRRRPSSCDYYRDYRNVRMIVVDAYGECGKTGVIRGTGLRWVEQVIGETPEDIDHIFISFHEPAFPRGRHVTDSFNANIKQRDAFWRMLLSAGGGRVRAVLVGHTHSYSRMRVRDPGSEAANDLSAFPNEDGGIYQIDAGAAGHGLTNTLVQIQVEGKDLFFRTLQAAAGPDQPFAECDRWELLQTHAKLTANTQEVKVAPIHVTAEGTRNMR